MRAEVLSDRPDAATPWRARFPSPCEIRCPTLVVHGDEDTILPPANGRAIAATIPGAAILVLARTGHELPPPVLPGLARRIAGHARQAR